MEERSNSKQNLINRISRRGLIQKKIKDILSIDQMSNSKQKDILLGQIIKDILWNIGWDDSCFDIDSWFYIKKVKLW